jgi:hypothetical protein
MNKPRKITVEAHGGNQMSEAYRHHAVPKVRLKGKWLAEAGLAPGSQIEVTVISRGVIELRLIEPRPADPQFARACGVLDAVLSKAYVQDQRANLTT